MRLFPLRVPSDVERRGTSGPDREAWTDAAIELLDLAVHMRHDPRSNVLRQTVLTTSANLSGALPNNVVYEVLNYRL
jgi:hypothetical protein